MEAALLFYYLRLRQRQSLMGSLQSTARQESRNAMNSCAAERPASPSTPQSGVYRMSPSPARMARSEIHILEGNVRTKWICSDTLYVVTGCHFDGSETTATAVQ